MLQAKYVPSNRSSSQSRTRRVPSRMLLWAATAAAMSGGGAAAQQPNGQPPSPPAVNPGRPTVTDCAPLTVPGYLELESGLYYAKGGIGLNYQVSQEFLFKLTDRPGRTEFRLSTSGYLFQRMSGNETPLYAQGLGDTTFGIQHLFVAQSPKTYDVSARLEYKLPTAARFLGTGKSDYNLLLLASKDYSDAFHADYNLGQALLGSTASSRYVAQSFASASFSYKIPHDFTLQTEIYGFSGNSVNGTNVANGYGVTYSPRPGVVYDGYIGFGLSRAAPAWTVTFGCTFFLGKLF